LESLDAGDHHREDEESPDMRPRQKSVQEQQDGAECLRDLSVLHQPPAIDRIGEGAPRE
jgi:hypothetical protein